MLTSKRGGKKRWNFCRSPSRLLGEMPAELPLSEGVEVTPAAELHQQAGELFGLEMGVERRQERVVQNPQDVPLGLSPPHLLPRLQHPLVHHLHRKQAPHPPELGEVHAPDVPAPKLLQKPEMAQPQLLILLFHALDRLPL